jgi:hypothetical protein
MKKVLLCLAGAVCLAMAPIGAAETLRGVIGDSGCATKHSADKHGGNAKSHEDCVKKCIENGAKFVFLSGDKIFKIANQDFADLKAHAGHEVDLTGEVKEDTITVSKIEMPKK